MVKYSRQRECILNNIRSRCDHPTADMVYESVRQELPNISLGTVYRNLTFLVKNGQIQKISTGTGSDRFDGCIHPHSHFICRYCGNIFDMEDLPEKKMIIKTSNSFPGEVEGYELLYYGKCKECLVHEK